MVVVKGAVGSVKDPSSQRLTKAAEFMADVAADVIAVIANKLRGERPPIQLTDHLEDLGIESLDAVEMIFELEEKFDITIPYNANDKRTEFTTVGDVVRAVEGLVNGKA